MPAKAYDPSRVYSSRHARRTADRSGRIWVAMVAPYLLFLGVIAAVVLLG